MPRDGKRLKHHPIPPRAGTPAALSELSVSPVGAGVAVTIQEGGSGARQGEVIQEHAVPPSLWPGAKAANLKLNPDREFTPQGC